MSIVFLCIPLPKVSRLGRFGLLIKRELLTSPDSERGKYSACRGIGVCTANSQPEVSVEIKKMRLVVREAGEGRRRRSEDCDDCVIENGLKNFKKFRKVHNIVLTIVH